MLQGTPHAKALCSAWLALLGEQPFNEAGFAVENLSFKLDAWRADTLRIPAGKGTFVDAQKVCSFFPRQKFSRYVWQTKPPKSGRSPFLRMKTPSDGVRPYWFALLSLCAVALDLSLKSRIWLALCEGRRLSGSRFLLLRACMQRNRVSVSSQH